MYPTFTGASRRPRNVNLSGQKNVNPFAASSWSPSTPSGASKTVAEAQAERRQRQQERERLKAAQDIQRTWRGHRERQNLRNSRRQAFDGLYAADAGLDDQQRTALAFPLLLVLFEADRDDDRKRLAHFAEDAGRSNFHFLSSSQLPPARLGRLVEVLIAALQR